jgi:DNA-binding transcriptional LysR family regulator
MSGHESEAVCFKLLHREPLVLAIPQDHPLASRAAVAMGDLAEEPMILLPRALEPLYEHLPNVVLADTPAASLMVHEAITLESTYSAVAAGLAVAVVVESTAQTMAVHGVVYRPFAPPQPALELGVAWPHGRMSTAVRAFLLIVAELAAPLEEKSGSRSVAVLPN